MQSDDADANEVMHELASRYFAALERGDGGAIRQCYDSSVRVWNSIHNEPLTADQHIALLQSGFFVVFSDRRFSEIRLNTFAEGFVRQHILIARRATDDQIIYLPICAVCKVRDGLLTHVEEYMSAP